MDDAKNVDNIVLFDRLQQAVQRDERSRSANASGAVDNDWLGRVGHASLAERVDKLDQLGWWLGHAEIGPRGKVEMTNDAILIGLRGERR